MLDCCKCENGPEASVGPLNLLLPRPIALECDGSGGSRGSGSDVLYGYHRSIECGGIIQEVCSN